MANRVNSRSMGGKYDPTAAATASQIPNPAARVIRVRQPIETHPMTRDAIKLSKLRVAIR
jgi:hypothetical protein